MRKTMILSTIMLSVLILASVGVPISTVIAANIQTTPKSQSFPINSLVVAENGVVIGNKTNLFDANATTILNVSAISVIDVDPTSNTGYLLIRYRNSSTLYTVLATMFYQHESWQNGGIATNILLHGTTGHGASTFPTTFAYLAGWGNATIYKNSTVAYSEVPFEFMYSYGLRNNTDYRAYNSTGNGIFNASDPNNIKVDPFDTELHVIINGSNFVSYFFFEDIVKYPLSILVNGYNVGNEADLFNFNGSNVVPIDGYTLLLSIRPAADTGLVLSKVRMDNTDYIIILDNFTSQENVGVLRNVTVFGNTLRGPGEYPETHAYLAGKGYSYIFANGSLTSSNTTAEFFLTEGLVDDITHAVYNSTKTGIYRPIDGNKVYHDTSDVEFHLFIEGSSFKRHLLFEDSLYISLDIQLQIVSFQLTGVLDTIDSLIAEAESLNQTKIVERLQKLKETLITLRNRISAVNATIGSYLDQLENELNETKTLLNETLTTLNKTQEELERTQRELDAIKFNMTQLKQNATFAENRAQYWEQSAKDNLILGVSVGLVVGIALGLTVPAISKVLSKLKRTPKSE